MTEPILEPVLEEGLPADEETGEPGELEGGFSRRALGWIVASVVISFVAFVLLANFGADLDQRPNPDANTFSHSALGHRALAGLLRSAGLGVVSRQAAGGRRRGAAPSPGAGGAGPGEGLATPGGPAPGGPGERGDPLVVVLPKWDAGEPQKGKPEWLGTVSLRPVGQVARVVPSWEIRSFRRSTPGASPLAPLRVDRQVRIAAAGSADRHGAGAAPGAGPGAGAPDRLLGGLLAARRPKTAARPQIVLIADPDLLNNHGLGRGENAAAVYRLFAEGLDATGVVFDETIHGFNRTPGLLAEALRFPMVLGVLQGLLLLGIVLWAGMSRFGKPLPAPAGGAAGKEVLIGNTAELLARGGHVGDSLGRYFHQTTRAVAAHYFLPADLPESERLARLQRLTGGRGGKLSLAVLEREINLLPDGRRAEAQAARIARQLHQWRVEMTNGN